MQLASNLIAEILVRPEAFLNASLADWDLIIRQGRRAMLLPRLCNLLARKKLIHKVPEAARKHLLSEYRYAEKLERSIPWEVRHIVEVVEPLGLPIVFLKGVAYVLAGDAAASGRLFSDFDILVPKSALQRVEQAFKAKGWVGTHQNEYDQRYYREWMHELPPMIHLQRQTTLDVHYNILPEVGRVCPDIGKLFDRVVRVGDSPAWILSPEDRIIHSSAHLFFGAEFEHGLRDLSDIDLLCRQYADADDFWIELGDRARELRLDRALFYALRYARNFFRTPVPESVGRKLADSGPKRILLNCMDALFLRALNPDHPSCNDFWTGFARWVLFLRSHWLRMPPGLLVRHLTRKTIDRWQRRDDRR